MEGILNHPWLNKTYSDLDAAGPWVAQFHWGWDPKPPAVISAADFDMDDIDVEGFDLDGDEDSESDDDMDEDVDEDDVDEDDVVEDIGEGVNGGNDAQVDEASPLCPDDFGHAVVLPADLERGMQAEHQIHNQTVFQVVLKHGRELIWKAYAACQRIVKLGQTILTAAWSFGK